MKKKLTLVVSLLLVMALSIGGTLAYLTYTTDTVVNTFTIGNITLTLTEDGAELNQTSGKYEKSYKIIPGTTAAKEPVLTVTAGSEECYVYALVENTVKIDDTVVATPNIDEDVWEELVVDGNKTLYRYCDPVNVLEATENWSESVFTEVAYSNTITEETIVDLAGTSITIQGFAHQKAGVTEEEANAAAIAQFELDAE